MALTFSTGVANQIASGLGWGDVIKGGVIDVYSGTKPTSPNDAATGTLLCRFTTNSGTLTAETRAHCRVAFAGGTLAAGDTVSMQVGGMTIGSFTGVAGAANTVAAAALANAVNTTWSFPDYYAVAAGTTIGTIRYGETANVANEVFIIGPKNAGTQINALSANLTVSVAANAAYAVNGASANTATTFANAAHGGGGTSANGTGIASANGLTMTYPANVGLISKSGVWSGNSTANGTAGYFRLLGTPGCDAGTTNLLTTGNDARNVIRIDGTVGTSGSDMAISSTTITANTAQTINQFDITIA